MPAPNHAIAQVSPIPIAPRMRRSHFLTVTPLYAWTYYPTLAPLQLNGTLCRKVPQETRAA